MDRGALITRIVRSTRVRVGIVIWGCALVGGLFAEAAGASQGIGAGVGAAPIALSQPAQAGAVYGLPSLYVVNTGSETATYRISLRRLPGQHGLTVPTTWVRIAPAQIRLTPGQSTMVGLKLAVPRRATVGQYRSGLVATAVLHKGGRNVSTGAAAATDLRFSVSGHVRPRSSWPLDTSLFVGIPVLAAGALLVWHHRGYSIRVERRPRA